MSLLEQRVLEVLGEYVSSLIARSIVMATKEKAGIDDLQQMPPEDLRRQLHQGATTFISEAAVRGVCTERLDAAIDASPAIATAAVERAASPDRSSPKSVTVRIDCETDILTARGQAHTLCQEIGFPGSAQIKVATVVSELARNIERYAKKGEIQLNVLNSGRDGIEIVATDNGPGIDDIDLVLSGDYKSKTGMGMGLLGTKKLMDEFDVRSSPETGTRVIARKYIRC